VKQLTACGDGGRSSGRVGRVRCGADGVGGAEGLDWTGGARVAGAFRDGVSFFRVFWAATSHLSLARYVFNHGRKQVPYRQPASVSRANCV
jgi:hypothetical protein